MKLKLIVITLFLYMVKKVNDFKKLDYSSMYSLNIAATQEIYIIILNLENRIKTYGLPGVRRTEGWPLNPWLGHRGLFVHPGGSPKDPVYRQRMALRFRHRKADSDRTTTMGLSSPAAIKWLGAVQPRLSDDSSPPSPE